MPKITHAELPGTEVEVSADSLPHYRAAGWVPVGEESPAEKSKDTTPMGRRATKKDGE